MDTDVTDIEDARAKFDESAQVDYFAFDEKHRVMLPDGRSFVEHQVLTEGARRKYLNKINREVKLNRSSGDASFQMATGDERHALLSSAITGWNLQRGGANVPFSTQTLDEFLSKADPRVVDEIEKDVRAKNPWLMNDLTVEDIDEEIKRLNEMREQKVREEEGKGA